MPLMATTAKAATATAYLTKSSSGDAGTIPCWINLGVIASTEYRIANLPFCGDVDGNLKQVELFAGDLVFVIANSSGLCHYWNPRFPLGLLAISDG